MKFSDKASKYLDTLGRDKDFIVPDRNQVIDYFDRQGIPAFEKVVEFQMEYSGLTLTIYNKATVSFKARLFSNKDIITNAPIDCLKIKGQYYFYCGDHKTSQFWFVLSQDGEICIYDNNEQTANKIFSSFEKFIETYAFEDLLSKKKNYEHPPFFDLINISEFDNLTNEYLHHFTANDIYNEWLSNDGLIIHKGKWFDRASFFIHVYGDNKLKCETFVQTLKDNKIIA